MDGYLHLSQRLFGLLPRTCSGLGVPRALEMPALREPKQARHTNIAELETFNRHQPNVNLSFENRAIHVFYLRVCPCSCPAAQGQSFPQGISNCRGCV